MSTMPETPPPTRAAMPSLSWWQKKWGAAAIGLVAFAVGVGPGGSTTQTQDTAEAPDPTPTVTVTEAAPEVDEAIPEPVESETGPEEVGALAMQSNLKSKADELAELMVPILEGDRESDSVDKVVLNVDSYTLEIAVTSRWQSADNVIDGAWATTRLISSSFYEGLLTDVVVKDDDFERALPALSLTVSEFSYHCSATFMVDLARSRASRADWEEQCS